MMYAWIKKTLEKNFGPGPANQQRVKRPMFLPVGSSWGAPRPKLSYHESCDEGYGKNIIVYRAIHMIAQNLAQVSWGVPNGLALDTQQQWQRLLMQPNPTQSWASFIEMLVSYWLISGNAYVEAVTDEQGKIVELYCLRPDRVRVVPGPHGLPTSYVYEVEGRKRTLNVDPDTGASAVLHLKFFNPRNDWYGLSPLQAAALAIDQFNGVGAHNLMLMENGGRPTGALILKPNELSNPMTDQDREQLRQELHAAYAGVGKAGKMMVLEGDVEWREMGKSPKDLDFLGGKYMMAREIAQAFGVPPMLVGVPGDATFANYKEARFHLWEDTLIPLLKRVMADFSGWALPDSFGEGFTFDAEKISALSVRRDSLWERLQSADFLTVDEKRAALGYGPLKNSEAHSKE